MAKHLPSLNEMEHQTLQLIEEGTSVTEQDLFLRVIENNSSFTKVITLMGQKYLLPPKSSFLLSDISCMQPLLNYRKTFDVIVIDPPWQNKSVKRSNRAEFQFEENCDTDLRLEVCRNWRLKRKGRMGIESASENAVKRLVVHREEEYSYLSPLQIKQIPIPKLAAPNCLVVTWVTNRQKHLRFIKEELYPSWSVEIVAEWHWVKITSSGEFVFPLDSPHKKPYEGLILGRVQEKTALPLR
ncbi:Methyltransferase-like protein 4 [Saguinus oedipus]|uniref:Methyltransferase-like protein 4 n=1 Tax=Saguinus oedipus TaxID=9490 RepID=A0ABQ9UBY8_SAGOE|nr:Methyltransferase-like protein 4 [Saguinus oedipus]